MEPTQQGSPFLPYRFANGMRNTPLSFGLHLGEELFPLSFAPDISHSTLASALPNLFFARLPGFPWRPVLDSNQR